MRPTRFLVLSLFFASLSSAQSACPPLQTPPTDPSKLLFTPGQEMELGEIIRQQFESDFQVIEDEQLTAYLRRIGDRVAAHLPDSGLRFQFVLYDRPEIQAFGMPGGRIYVSRKMAAFLRSEDELAGVLGHEMGHLAARQQALEMSRDFREILGVKTVSTTDDLFEMYNQMVETYRLKKPHRSSSDDENKNQIVADKLGVQSVARAGFASPAYPDFLDRLLQTRGKTGSWFSDLFGATKPDSRRLREALKDVAALPAACIDARTLSKTDEFHQWQTATLHYRGLGHSEQLGTVLSRNQLNQPLRGDIESFRFSPDGKYLIAQDDGGIYVLTRDPLRFVFRIDAVDAEPAQFNPDSTKIVFFTSSLRVETWDVALQELVNVADVPALRGCRDSALSPDARFLACFDNELALNLYDVATGEAVFRKEKFFDFEPGFSGFDSWFKWLYFVTHQHLTVLRFSPDSRYFAASSRTKEEVLIDLETLKKMSIPGSIETLMRYSFAFAGSGRIVGVDSFSPQKSILAEFPSGRLIDHVPLGEGEIVASSDPNFLLIRPMRDFAVGAYDLTRKLIVMSNRMAAFDAWGGFFASERLNGEIGLYKVGSHITDATLQLPLGKLGGLSTFTASPDLKYIALSSRTRGAVWNLESNSRLAHMRSFKNAFCAANGNFFLEFPQFEKSDREMAALSPVTLQSKSRPVEKDDDVTFFGSVLLRTRHNDKEKKDRKNFELDALDMATQSPLWSRHFPKQGPSLLGSPSSGKIILFWPAKADGLHDALARDSNLQARWTKANPGNTDFFAEVVDAREGKTLGGVVLRTGKYSILPERLESVAGWLTVVDSANRVLVYSLATGEQKAKWFGFAPRISPNGERLCLANGRGHLVLYDLRTLRKGRDLYFANPIAAHLFSADGKKLLVLTNDQTVFVIDTASEEAASSATRLR